MANKTHYVAVDAPTIHHSRSRFDLSFDLKTSGSVGKLYPVYVQEIYPGDTFNCDASIVTRLASSYLRPVMDNLFLDMYFFFVPNRLVYDNWEGVLGENKTSAWAQPSPVTVPTGATGTVSQGTVADYLGLPIGTIPNYYQILPFRAFARIYDEWFRDENLVAPMLIQTGNTASNEVLNSNAWSPSNYFGQLPSVSKFHDIFTSALPGTQKGNSATVPTTAGLAKIVTGVPGYMIPTVDTTKVNTQVNVKLSSDNSQYSSAAYNLGVSPRLNTSEMLTYRSIINTGSSSSSAGNLGTIVAWNLYADLNNAGFLDVPSLRYAFQLQRILERSARCGTRYTEYLLSAFGVSSPDARLQRSEYLGGKRMPLSVQQVAQNTRGDTDSTKLGSLGAFSLSNGKCGYQKGFVEHGFVIGVMCVRQHHTYQQGIEKFWQRSSRFDYYDPILANISEVPVYRSEIFGTTSDVTDNLDTYVFGYQEAWYDLRQRMNKVTGAMRSDNTATYDIWHYGDDYANAPTLNQQFITEIPDYVDRTIAVPSTSADQFIFDIYFKQSAVRVLPTYSIPGLIDHN